MPIRSSALPSRSILKKLFSDPPPMRTLKINTVRYAQLRSLCRVNAGRDET